MNKIEFQRRLEEVDSLLAKGKYSDVVKKCDILNLELVDQPRRLQSIAKAYEKCRRYADAEALLLQALEQAPRSRGIVYHLCSVATKAGDLQEAKKYYEVFCRLAKNDSRRYLLQYRISRSSGAREEELIEILEAYRAEEPDDRWMLELAKLYAESGNIDKALEVCDDISLWFTDGKYVEEALVLREQLLGESGFYDEEEELEEMSRKTGRSPEEPEELREYSGDEEAIGLPGETRQETRIHGEEEGYVDAREGNLYGAPAADAELLTEESLKSIAQNVSYYSLPSAGKAAVKVTYEEEPVTEEEQALSEEELPEVPVITEELPEEEDVFRETVITRPQKAEAAAKASEGKKPKGTEVPSAPAGSGKTSSTYQIPEYVAPVFDEEVPDVLPEERSAVRKKTEKPAKIYREQMVIDFDEEEAPAPEEIWQDPEILRAEEELKRQEAASADPSTWGYITFDDEEEEDAVETGAGSSEDEEAGTGPEEAAFHEEEPETTEAVGPEEEAAKEEEAAGTEEETAEEEEAAETEEEAAEDFEAAPGREIELRESVAEDIPSEILPEIETPDILIPEETAEEESPEAETQEAWDSLDTIWADPEDSGETEKEETDRKPEKTGKTNGKPVRDRSPEALQQEFSEDEEFNAFLQEVQNRKRDRSLFGGLPIEPEVTEETWHFVVFGESNMLTTECARERMKEISEENTSCPETMLKISSDRIGEASIVNSLDHFLGNMVIVEQAASLSDEQLREFAKILDRDDRSLLVAFTDSRKDMIDMFRRVPELAESFTAVFEGKNLNARDLVNTAKEYLLSQDARMTPGADGMVYEKARKLLAERKGFYKNEIRKYAEAGLAKADRGFLGLLGGKCDEEGYLVVDEKHFKKAEKE